jgi:hypothetical protein
MHKTLKTMETYVLPWEVPRALFLWSWTHGSYSNSPADPLVITMLANFLVDAMQTLGSIGTYYLAMFVCANSIISNVRSMFVYYSNSTKLVPSTDTDTPLECLLGCNHTMNRLCARQLADTTQNTKKQYQNRIQLR